MAGTRSDALFRAPKSGAYLYIRADGVSYAVISYVRRIILAVLLAGAVTPALAQNPDAFAADPDAHPPSPEALALARQLVAETDTGDIATLGWLSLPMGRLMHDLAIVKPEQSKAIMHDAIIPVLTRHAAELRDIQAKTFAAVLTMDDLKGAVAFYATPAGKALVAIHGPLLQLNLAGVTAWLETLKPEIQAKLDEVQKAHGWGKG